MDISSPMMSGQIQGFARPKSNRSEAAAAPDKLTVDTASLAKLLGISDSHLHTLKRSGRLGPTAIKLGRSRRYLITEIQRWLEAGAPSRTVWLARNAGVRSKGSPA